jgi:endonuclease/exonuclease/phosphatase family metal-dependent hydrolase
MRPLGLLALVVATTSCALLGTAGSREGDLHRVATYNIRHGVGMDGRLMLERTATALRGLDAELIALEEVDQRVHRSGQVDQAATLGDLLGMEHAFASFMDYDGGRYGLALLSRHPIASTETIVLPPGDEEPRVALHARVVFPDADTVSVFVVHFDWLGNDAARVRQASTLISHVTQRTDPWLIMGDFNDQPGSRTLRLFDAVGQVAAKPAARHLTFPADTPVSELDHVVTSSPDWIVSEVMVIADSLSSDHRPVVATMTRRRQ